MKNGLLGHESGSLALTRDSHTGIAFKLSLALSPEKLTGFSESGMDAEAVHPDDGSESGGYLSFI